MSEPDISSDDEPSPDQSIDGPAPGLHPTNKSDLQAEGIMNASASSGRVRDWQPNNRTSFILPTEKVFSIQVGTELFRLSGASISSDGPSYFTQFFEDQVRQNEETGGPRTLYIDRDPATFRDIARHLQGYFIKPVNGEHFVRLFADAQFYSLPRFIEQLFDSEIFIQIGEQHFQIPKELFGDLGNSPNFFSLGFAVFFSTPGDAFPGLDKRGLLRPPPINPPYVPGRSSEIFSQLLHMLRGYPLRIRDETHRAELLRDCRYFHLRALEQRVIAHDISYNIERQRAEICLKIQDVKPSGISFKRGEENGRITGGWVHYQRPFVDETNFELVIEIGGETTSLDAETMRLDLYGATKKRVASLLTIVANKMNLPLTTGLGLIMLSGGSPSPSRSPGFSSLSDDQIKVIFDEGTAVILDGEVCEVYDNNGNKSILDEERAATASPVSTTVPTHKMARKNTPSNNKVFRNPSTAESTPTTAIHPPVKRRKIESAIQPTGKWSIKTGQWRIRVLPTADPNRTGFEIAFVAVKLDAFSNERARNLRRAFLT